jgi:hypothetical protein
LVVEFRGVIFDSNLCYTYCIYNGRKVMFWEIMY